MAHTQDAVIYDDNGVICMIVIPDDDAELNDLAYNPPNWTHLRVPHSPQPQSDVVGAEAHHPVEMARALHPHLNLRYGDPLDPLVEEGAALMAIQLASRWIGC